ncbi:hypothetical protein IP90_00941 [Luteimonas cucumeris]|uniref:Uncharacterized protein n=1 Tax=Luteimonas cucumeris TaxID=985012 RepID=A0A562LAV9_9GAMM|nr:hypothetical protein [Luteimonas cucumeris]TWI04803.1 hypothetical protein IP90_00941 [Luteimonas cucumeris]
MSFTTAAKNTALNAISPDFISLHSGFPGNTGANELAGSGYARVAASFNSASGGVRTITAAVNFTVGAGHTVRWAGLWQAGSFVGYSPNGGNPKEFIASAATDVVTCLAHGYADTQKIVFYGDTVPAGLTEGTVYFVRDATTDTFKVAATSGGAAIDLTGTGSTGCVVSAIVEDVYGGASTHTVNSWSLGAIF